MSVDTIRIPGEGDFPLIKPLVGFADKILRQTKKHPFRNNVFLMMKFRDSNKDLSDFIIETLARHGLVGVRADAPEWNLTRNVYNPLAVLYCCKFGIALFDEPEERQVFSPNVAYELGMMHYQQKECLILRHDSLPAMPFDLIKDLHRSYSKDLQVRGIIEEWILSLDGGDSLSAEANTDEPSLISLTGKGERSPDTLGMESDPEVLRSPVLSLSLAPSKFQEPIGRKIQIRVRHLTVPRPDEVPNYSEGSRSFLSTFDTANPDYLRDLVKYVRAKEQRAGFYLVAMNEGTAVASDVRMEARADRATGLRLSDSSTLPMAPERNRPPLALDPNIPAVTELSRDLWVKRRGDNLLVDAEFGKLQPGAISQTGDLLFVGATASGSYQIEVKLFCDELPEPVVSHIDIDVEVIEEEADIERVQQLDEEEFFTSDAYREYQESVEGMD